MILVAHQLLLPVNGLSILLRPELPLPRRARRRLATLRNAIDKRSSNLRRTSAIIVSCDPPFPLPSHTHLLTHFIPRHAGGNLGHENFDRSQMRTTPVRPHLPPPSDVLATQRTDMNTGRTPKSKQKRLRKFFSWTSRRQQLPTAHIPQPHAGLEDEDLQCQAAVQASLEEAGGDSWERTGYSASTGFPSSSLLTLTSSNSTTFSTSRRSTNEKPCR